ncbi:cyclopentanol dehydrogenase [Levilactobacillus namurensis DSM 19117]|uniref:Cyclopentanol dehydrogenase n=2 Tax=Lactobacillaceae TaxID=33958 RepID=A0A0R1JYB8_9LACO|nr:glucose 1-dehydrogenase [Levilactobacillus namurensis]KRK76197.1 cyclopentanol dehydrogenase [Levilactobacillus namurensis DSM 19117]GEO74618.1 3-alpha-hydroxysteroid dehydrogenase [Levilactobacillus namurensis]
MDFNGKVVIVTGAAQGMGASHAKAFIDHGATVVLTDVNATEGQATADKLGDHAHFMAHDVTSEADWHQVIDQTVSQFGHLDVLVNNAGITYSKSLFDVSTDDYLKIFKINQLSVFLGTKFAAAAMKAQHHGSIVNVSSINGLVGGAVGYTDTKFAVRGFSKAAALELAHYGIRVNSVHPGVIDTPMIHQGDTDEAVKQFAKMIPLQRVAQPEEISKAVLFLASDDSSYATGAEFVFDGGLTAQ